MFGVASLGSNACSLDHVLTCFKVIWKETTFLSGLKLGVLLSSYLEWVLYKFLNEQIKNRNTKHKKPYLPVVGSHTRAVPIPDFADIVYSQLYWILNKLKLFRLGSSCIDTIMASCLWLLGVSLNLEPKYFPTLPEMSETIGLLSTALALAYSLLNMLAL